MPKRRNPILNPGRIKRLLLIAKITRKIITPRTSHILALLAVLVFAAQGVYYAHHMDVDMDEGTYLMKGVLYLNGTYQPFQEYGPWTNKMPLAYYIPGAAQVLFGPGLRTGRYFSVFLGVVMLAGLWLAGKRVAGRWWAAAILWLVAINPANIIFYSLAISQVLTICLLAWCLALTLGEKPPLWQVLAGAALAALTVMVRQNMLPVVGLLALFLIWQRGWKTGLLAGLVSLVVLGIFHAIWWPGIMDIWAPYIPAAIRIRFNLLGPATGAVTSPWDPSYAPLTRLYVFLEGLRYNFAALFGAVCAWILWPQRKAWRSATQWKTAVYLSVLLVVLTAAHIWAALGGDYCVYCYPGYLAFFSITGLLLVAVSAAAWVRRPGWLRSLVAALAVLMGFTGIGFGAYQSLAMLVMNIQVPRMRGGQIQPGFTDLWRLLANKFGWTYDLLQQMLPTAAGFTAGVVFLLGVMAVFIIWRKHRLPVKPATAALAGFLLLGILLSPASVMGGGKFSELCTSGDVIVAHEAVGAHLAQYVPPGSLVYWENDISPIPLLYLPGIRIFPAQLNHWYSYYEGGNSAELERYGYWNAELALKWRGEADYLLIADRYILSHIEITDGSIGHFDELAPTPSTVPCRNRSIIHIFQRVAE